MVGVETVFVDQQFAFNPSFVAFVTGILGNVAPRLNIFKSKSLVIVDTTEVKLSTMEALRVRDIDRREPASPFQKTGGIGFRAPVP